MHTEQAYECHCPGSSLAFSFATAEQYPLPDTPPLELQPPWISSELFFGVSVRQWLRNRSLRHQYKAKVEGVYHHCSLKLCNAWVFLIPHSYSGIRQRGLPDWLLRLYVVYKIGSHRGRKLLFGNPWQLTVSVAYFWAWPKEVPRASYSNTLLPGSFKVSVTMSTMVQTGNMLEQ